MERADARMRGASELLVMGRGCARLVVCSVVGNARRRAETVVRDNDGMRGTRGGGISTKYTGADARGRKE